MCVLCEVLQGYVGYFLCFCFELILHIDIFYIITYVLDIQMTVRRDISYNKNQLDALISQIYFWNKTLHVSDSSSVHRREFFTVHTLVVYVDGSILILLTSCQQTCMTYTIAVCTVKNC